MFIEYFATLEPSEDEDEHSIDSGVTYLLSDDVQLDLSAGVGLNRAAPDFFISVGFAWRFSTRWSRR
ncbi:MAG: transporter [Deltaproteobacteria bacterium]|nr:transporter [Deltaproteobacteria bacterium]